MPTLRLLAVASLVSVAGCAAMGDPDEPVGNEQLQIVGGQPALPGAYPAVVALTDNKSLCTATLVHPEWVLTAAHCVTPALTGYTTQEQVTAAFFVIFDDINVIDQNFTGQKLVGLKETITHPNWDPTKLGDNDVAVLHLEIPVTDRAPVPIHRGKVAAGTLVLQVGFGVDDPAAKAGAGVLRTLATSTTGCAQYGYTDAVLCFNADDGDGTCFGDSGGPTFVDAGAGKFEVAGLTSFGTSELCTGMNASTHVASELAFIDQYIPTNTPTTGQTPTTEDPVIGPPPTIFGDCSIAAGGGDTSSAAGAGVLLLASFAWLALARRRRARARRRT